MRKQNTITAMNIAVRNKKIIDYWEANKDKLTDADIRLNLYSKGLGSHMTTFRVLAKYKAEKYQAELPKYKESEWAKYFFTKMVKESDITKAFKAEFDEIAKSLDCKKYWKICFDEQLGYYLKVRIAIGKLENSCMINLMQRNVQLMVDGQAIVRKLIDDTL